MISDLIIKEEVGPGNVPKALFISSIEEFVGDRPVYTILENIQLLNRKYKIMENSIKTQQESLIMKIPDIELAIEAVSQRKKLLNNLHKNELFFPVSDNLFAKCSSPPSNTIYLWLGANTILEYPLEEAIEVLKSNLSTAKNTIKLYQDSLDFIREQITIMDVNTARVHNYGVMQRKQNKV
ncbi:prefoldin subunit family [Cryptosporidium sp. chipmunk genotype I]|uniref:prefoldin subunit family n=1 Tax=Cryptosporidium sp. chipmunk genotype I TaxID=1280935 RepID=UPI00351A2A30|nr:prefoldin subunit family [Cryptosporidium sp. chipmunk genotype I]